VKTVDNYVGNVYKGQLSGMSFNGQNNDYTLRNKVIIVKDTDFNQYVPRETLYPHTWITFHKKH